jgi:pantoate--beta-alanine ligase
VLIVRTVAELRDALRRPRRDEQRIGLVPTMGALHDGHLSLLHHARGACDTVVMSLFVNPRQFNEAGDLAGYPRNEARDIELAAAAGVDVLFAPSPEDVYPPGFATTVSVAGPGEGLEADHRGRGHFDGVATVVCKLLNMVCPAVAYFGAKDVQQAAVVRRLVRDLDMDVEIEERPTVRERDGLAMSSRNALLSPGERARATALHAGLAAVRDAVHDGEQDPAAAAAAGLPALTAAGVELDYLTVVDPVTMAPLRRIDRDALAVVAARLGAVRLIDNLAVSPRPRPDTDRAAARPERGVATPTGASTA